ncbi:MAG: ATP-binding protein [Sandaracinaceae bacterium]|nr:ATP-binding protein [Sandaracinaceae bacterium]
MGVRGGARSAAAGHRDPPGGAAPLPGRRQPHRDRAERGGAHSRSGLAPRSHDRRPARRLAHRGRAPLAPAPRRRSAQVGGAHRRGAPRHHRGPRGASRRRRADPGLGGSRPARPGARQPALERREVRRARGPIEVSVRRGDGEARVTVTDRGRGIPEEELPCLFTRFARTREARAGRAPGLGLGLYITKGLVEAHGGRIEAENVPGVGTRFSVTLPAMAQAQAELTVVTDDRPPR